MLPRRLPGRANPSPLRLWEQLQPLPSSTVAPPSITGVGSAVVIFVVPDRHHLRWPPMYTKVLLDSQQLHGAFNYQVSELGL